MELSQRGMVLYFGNNRPLKIITKNNMTMATQKEPIKKKDFSRYYLRKAQELNLTPEQMEVDKGFHNLYKKYRRLNND